ncbi:hypothetical protein FB45DRAFT_1055588 [Roridomyces roridus]|uniref:ERCC4 domain-containing protein n=1 Tax=Roridomyces roridus TaxID=1738132 RepID=A0AAD7C5V3_9AGAR|nr:hypothetical protein FB45DRAFT_1055588 [Roridomyces roridus]
MSDVIDISSDSEDESSSRPASQLSNSYSFCNSNSSSDFVDLCDSDSDDAPARPVPSSSQTPMSDYVDLCSSSSDSDDEFPALGGPRFLQGIERWKRKRKPSTAGSSSGAYDVDSSEDEDESPRKIARKDSNLSGSSFPLYGEDSSEDEEDSPARVARKKAARKPRKTDEKKAAEKALKQQAAAQKKQEREDLKAAKAAEVAEAKEAKKLYRAVNKLVTDKKQTLVDMELIFPPVTAGSPLEALRDAFKDQVAPFGMRVTTSRRRRVLGYDVLSWRRVVRTEYKVEAREFHAVEPRIKMEGTHLVYLSVGELVRCIREEDGGKGVVRCVREAYGPEVQVFIMTDGLGAYYRRVGNSKSRIEGALAALQMAENVHLLHIDDAEDGATRLYDLSGDLGIKQHKLISRAHLPFCSNTSQGSGTTQWDTMVKMLDQVHRVTRAGAEGIVDEFQTLARLFEAYEQDPVGRDDLVKDCIVKSRVDGARNTRPLGKALSKRVGTVMYGKDPLKVVYKDKD